MKCSCPTGIRTPTNRSRVCRATVTPSGREEHQKNIAHPARLRQPVRRCPAVRYAVRRTRTIANAGKRRGAIRFDMLRRRASACRRSRTVTVRFSSTTEIAVPPERVYECLTDLEGYGAWMRRAGAYRAAHRRAVRNRNPLARGAPRLGPGKPGGVRGHRRPDPPHAISLYVDGSQGSSRKGAYHFRYRLTEGAGGAGQRPAWSWIQKSTCPDICRQADGQEWRSVPSSRPSPRTRPR